MVYLFYVVHIRFVLSYTKIEGLRICKVHVGGNKWCIYFMLTTCTHTVYSVLHEDRRYTFLLN